MDSPKIPDDLKVEGAERGSTPDDHLGMVPAQGKHAARPSEADQRQTLHEPPPAAEPARDEHRP